MRSSITSLFLAGAMLFAVGCGGSSENVTAESTKSDAEIQKEAEDAQKSSEDMNQKMYEEYGQKPPGN